MHFRDRGSAVRNRIGNAGRPVIESASGGARDFAFRVLPGARTDRLAQGRYFLRGGPSGTARRLCDAVSGAVPKREETGARPRPSGRRTERTLSRRPPRAEGRAKGWPRTAAGCQRKRAPAAAQELRAPEGGSKRRPAGMAGTGPSASGGREWGPGAISVPICVSGPLCASGPACVSGRPPQLAGALPSRLTSSVARGSRPWGIARCGR